MIRSTKKGLYIAEHLLKKVLKQQQEKDNTPIKTWARSSTIIPQMIGMTLLVHNGRHHLPVYVSESMIGSKLGEFSHTRTYKGHTSLNKKINRKK